MFQLLVHDKAGRVAYHALGSAPLHIGRSDDNDLVLPDASVSKSHAILEQSTRGFVLRDLGSTNGVFLDGERALGGEPIEVGLGSVIGIGDYKLILAAAPAPARGGFHIGVTEPNGRHHVFAARGQEVTLGSDHSCDVLLEGDGVAPRHLRVIEREGRLIIADLRSATGTFRNQERVQSPIVVHPTDLIRVGCFHLTFSDLGTSKPLTAPALASVVDERTIPTQEPVEEADEDL
ncbi:MAG: FHA domain-containing protein [Myxococcota bacterium]